MEEFGRASPQGLFQASERLESAASIHAPPAAPSGPAAKTASDVAPITRGQIWTLAILLGCLPCTAAFLVGLPAIIGAAALATSWGWWAAGLTAAGGLATAGVVMARRRRACPRP